MIPRHLDLTPDEREMRQLTGGLGARLKMVMTLSRVTTDLGYGLWLKFTNSLYTHIKTRNIKAVGRAKHD